MTRTELKAAAKSLVFNCGASNCLEFTDEMIQNHYLPDDLTADEREYLHAQVVFQAQRVAEFLGM